MKKAATLILAIFLLCCAVPLAACAEVPKTSGISSAIDLLNNDAVRTDETEWIYRNNNGICEKRLWSYTYNKWLTDWMPC